MGFLKLEREKAPRDLIAALQYIKEAYKKDEEMLFAKAYSDRISGNSFKLKGWV